MFKIKTLNHIAPAGLKQFCQNQYDINADHREPDALLLRSHSLYDYDLPASVKVIARAGAGVNNIPVDKLTKLGIPVLNTPGANANAVKELVVAAMLIASRRICQGWNYALGLQGDDDSIHKQVETEKKQFTGYEIYGRKLGVIGLGAIGVKVANVALSLGMEVIGFDPNLTVHRAWELSSQVQKAASIEAVLAEADFISLHVPLSPETQHLLNHQRLQLLKPNTVVLNFARSEIVEQQALLDTLGRDSSFFYVTDFPSRKLLDHPNVIAMPHLGASTQEAEQNCAIMAAQQICDFLQAGTICNSVNFPEVRMAPNDANRIAIVNANVPNMVGQISTCFAEANLNIVDLVNRSRDEVAYTLVDLNPSPSAEVLQAVTAIEGVLSVRVLPGLEDK